MFVQQWIHSNYLNLFQIHLSRLLHVDTIKVIFVDQEEKKVEQGIQIIPAQLIKQISEKNPEAVRR